jgi:hypothetical protein
MTNVISMAAAHRIWMAHREIEAGTTLLTSIDDALQRGEDATPLDPFGRRRAYQLGAPMGDNTHKLLDVSPRLARHIIEAHIAEKRRELVEATLAARIEMERDDPQGRASDG